MFPSLTNWKWVGLTDWIKSVWITNKDWLMKLTKSDWVTSKVWLRVDGFQARENLSTFLWKKCSPKNFFDQKYPSSSKYTGCCQELDKICLTNWKWVGLTDWFKSVWITNKVWLMKLTKYDWVTSKVWLRVDGFQTRENLNTFFMKKMCPPEFFW